MAHGRDFGSGLGFHMAWLVTSRTRSSILLPAPTPTTHSRAVGTTEKAHTTPPRILPEPGKVLVKRCLAQFERGTTPQLSELCTHPPYRIAGLLASFPMHTTYPPLRPSTTN